MAGSTLVVRVDDSTAVAALQRAAAASRSLRPAWASAGEHLRNVIRGHFDAGGRPGAWPKSKTRAKKTLVASGRLQRSITCHADQTGVELATNVIYGAAHQFGATIRPKNRKWLTIPAGPGVKRGARTYEDTWFYRSGSRLALLQKGAGKRGRPRVLFELVKQVTLPPRPYLVVRDEDLDAVGAILIGYVAEKFGG